MWNLQLMSFSAYTKQLAGERPRSLPPAQGPCRGSWRRIVGFPTPSELSPVISQTDSSAKDPRALLPGSPCWPALPGVMRVGQLWGFLTSCVRLHTLLARAAGERGGVCVCKLLDAPIRDSLQRHPLGFLLGASLFSLLSSAAHVPHTRTNSIDFGD